MGKLEKIGAMLRKLGGSKRRRAATTSSTDSSDEEQNLKTAGSAPNLGLVHTIAVDPDTTEGTPQNGTRPLESPDQISNGYATDDTVFSSLNPLDLKTSPMDYNEGSESQGYYSTAELSPREELIPKSREVEIPKIIAPRYIKKEFPRINISQRDSSKSSSNLCADLVPISIPIQTQHLSLSNLSNIEQDPIDRFLKSSIYKTKMITTVFEGEFQEIASDAIFEIDRWFESKNMMAVACEMHWSTPREKRSRQAECRLKEKLLNALRENNRRLLYLRGMGHGKTPIKLAESKTVENITRDKETDSVRGIYQRSYTRLIPYLHKETPEWHSQYWQLSDFSQNSSESENKPEPKTGPLVQPDPQHFLFGSEPKEVLANTSLISLNIIGLSILGNNRKSSTYSMFLDLLITAHDAEDEKLTRSTVLRVEVENLYDNLPQFLESAAPVFQIPLNTTKPLAIGRLTAYDTDKQPIFYHILPSCGSEAAANFTIDPDFGEIIYNPRHAVQVYQKVEICVIATSEKSPDLMDMFFDSAARNMKKVVVWIGDQNSVQGSDMFIAGNRSVVSVGDSLEMVEIPIQMAGKVGDFKLRSLNFVPANFELGRDMLNPEGSVDMSPQTGELIANPKILDTPQGIYTATIEKGSNSAIKYLHHMKNDRKLRYVLGMSRNEFGANLEKLQHQINDAFDAGKNLEIFFDEPQMDKRNSSWTSVCFYISKDHAILDEKQANALLSTNNGHIAKLHHIFKVINIENCEPRNPKTENLDGILPLNTLILISVVGLLIILLIGLLTYICCVSKYRNHLEKKTERLRTSSPASYYKSPGFIVPPGTYIHHSPPQAVAYY